MCKVQERAVGGCELWVDIIGSAVASAVNVVAMLLIFVIVGGIGMDWLVPGLSVNTVDGWVFIE